MIANTASALPATPANARRKADAPRSSKSDQQADRCDGEAQVLLHEQQGERPPGHGAPAFFDQRDQGTREKGDRDGDLVEVDRGGLEQTGGQSVGDAEQGAAGVAQSLAGEPGDGHGGQAERHGLCQQEHDRALPDPEQGRQQGERRTEVIAQHVEPNSVDRGDRRSDVGVVVDDLREDPKIPRGGVEVGVANQRNRGMSRRDADSDQPRHEGCVGRPPDLHVLLS
jgi:hypothetical protein